jgi:transposase InsO family protein
LWCPPSYRTAEGAAAPFQPVNSTGAGTSPFSTRKIELAHEADWATHAAARADVSEYLEIFFNRQRRHWALGYLSPVAFERQHDEKQAA